MHVEPLIYADFVIDETTAQIGKPFLASVAKRVCYARDRSKRGVAGRRTRAFMKERLDKNRLDAVVIFAEVNLYVIKAMRT